MDNPLVYVVILTWNHKDVTADCLQSVSAVDYPRLGAIVVDNASQDGTAEFVRRTFPHVRVVENERNLGYAAGCNVGIRYALERGADYVLLLNNDTLVQPNLVELLASWAEAHPDDAILTPLIRYADEPERVWCAGSRRRRLTLDSQDFGPGRPERVPIDHVREVDYVMGCAMFVRAETFRQIGLFDESLFFYYEDLDFSLRAQAAGYKLRYVPGSTVWHRVQASTSDAPPLRYYYKARGSVRFFRKHVRGPHWLIILPYRLGSGVKTVTRLLYRGQAQAARAYLQGLWDGVRGHYWNEYRGHRA